MLSLILCIAGFVVGGIVFFFVGTTYRKKVAEKEIGSAEEEARRIINEAIKGGESKKHEMLLEAKEEIRRAGGVDIVLTHAPARGFGDAEDFAHCGFEAFLPLLDRYQPRYLIHGHVHTEYGHAIPRVLQRGGTTIINACERYTLEL